MSQQMSSNMTCEDYSNYDRKTAYVMNVVQSNDRIVVDKKQGLVCYVVNCDHTVPCAGYCFSKVKHVLKPDYKHLSGPEIGQLWKQKKNTLCFAF